MAGLSIMRHIVVPAMEANRYELFSHTNKLLNVVP